MAERTAVPLLNSYKYGLVGRRLLQTATGGLRLQRAHCLLHALQLAIYFAPLALAIPVIILDAVKVWNEYYLALVYTFIHTLAVISLRTCVHCVKRGRHSEQSQSDMQLDDDDDDDAIGVTSCRDILDFIFRSKHTVSLVLHSLFVCGLLSFASSLVLLPRVLTAHLPSTGAVVVGIAGWLVTCGAHYSLNVSHSRETAVYRPTDLLELGPLMRPVYLISCATAIVAVRLTVSTEEADVYVQLLYVVVCVLPLCWMIGLLPPLDALLPWAMEQILTRLLGGSHMATDIRLLVMFLLSLFSTVIVAITAEFSTSPAALLLSAITGYLLSQDIFLLSTNIPFNCLPRKSQTRVRWKSFFRHLLISSLRGSILVILSVLIVYFSSTARGMARGVASRVVGSCIIALTVFFWTSDACQGTHVLGLFRNPLHPWRSDNVKKYKSQRKRLSYCSYPRTLLLTYVSPLLIQVFVTLETDGDAHHQWLRAVGTAQIFRKVWQNTSSAHSEVSIVSLLLLVLPEDTVWRHTGVGLQTLLVGLSLDVFTDSLLKLRFMFTSYLTFAIKDRKKIKPWLYILITVGSPLLLPLLLATTLFSSIISAPLLPLFTLPVFLVSFPRTRRFWPSLADYGSSHSSCSDSVYYERDTPHLVRAIQEALSTGSVCGQPGEYFLLRYEDRTVIATILERGYCHFTLCIRGLEMQETSCHTIEAARIDDIFSNAYNPKSLKSPSFWLNCHPLNTMQPVDSTVIHTYSNARSVLTGIIDQPSALTRFSGNLLKCIVWVLYQHVIARQRREEGREGEGEHMQQVKHRVGWSRRNKIVPMVNSETPQSTSEPTQQLRHENAAIHATTKPSRQVKNAIGTGTEDVFSWTSIDSDVEESYVAREYHGPQYTLSDLIPADIPLSVDTNPTHVRHVEQGGHPMSSETEDNSESDHLKKQQLPLPSQWLEFPLLDSQLEAQLHQFPSDWLIFISGAGGSRELPAGDTALLAFKKLCLTCFSIVDVHHCSLGTVQTRPFHIHSGFRGEFPYSTDRDWLVRNQDLYELILKAYRYAVKLLCDEAALGEAEDLLELSGYLQSYHSDYHIGSEEEPEWNRAMLDHKPHLFSIGKSQDTATYTAHMLTLQDQVAHIGQLNSAAVHAVWSNLALELFYLTNDDEERYSIQAHPSLLRNLTIQAADPPLGYTVYSSGIIRCPHIV